MVHQTQISSISPSNMSEILSGAPVRRYLWASNRAVWDTTRYPSLKAPMSLECSFQGNQGGVRYHQVPRLWTFHQAFKEIKVVWDTTKYPGSKNHLWTWGVVRDTIRHPSSDKLLWTWNVAFEDIKVIRDTSRRPSLEERRRAWKLRFLELLWIWLLDY